MIDETPARSYGLWHRGLLRRGPTESRFLRPAPSCLARRAAPPGAGAETDLFGQPRTLGRVVGRHHGIVGRQLPAFAIFLGRHVEGRLEMPLQHLELLAVFETDDEIGRNGA